MTTQIDASAWGLFILSLVAVFNVIGIVVVWVYLSRILETVSHFTTSWIEDRLDLLRFEIKSAADSLLSTSSREGTSHSTGKGPATGGVSADRPVADFDAMDSGAVHASSDPTASTDVMRIGLGPGVTLTVKNNRPGGEFSNMG